MGVGLAVVYDASQNVGARLVYLESAVRVIVAKVRAEREPEERSSVGAEVRNIESAENAAPYSRVA